MFDEICVQVSLKMVSFQFSQLPSFRKCSNNKMKLIMFACTNSILFYFFLQFMVEQLLIIAVAAVTAPQRLHHQRRHLCRRRRKAPQLTATAAALVVVVFQQVMVCTLSLFFLLFLFFVVTHYYIRKVYLLVSPLLAPIANTITQTKKDTTMCESSLAQRRCANLPKLKEIAPEVKPSMDYSVCSIF